MSSWPGSCVEVPVTALCQHLGTLSNACQPMTQPNAAVCSSLSRKYMTAAAMWRPCLKSMVVLNVTESGCGATNCFAPGLSLRDYLDGNERKHNELMLRALGDDEDTLFEVTEGLDEEAVAAALGQKRWVLLVLNAVMGFSFR